MSTFIIFGATGATGRFLLPKLRARADHVVGVSRHPPPGDEQLSWIRGDLFAGISALPEADVVLSLGPLDAFSRWLEQAPLAGARRVIALSSMSVDTKRASPDAGERALAAQIEEAERRIARTCAARAIAWTILRPTLIYGDGSDRSLAPIVRFARRTHILPIPIGASGLRQPVHAADLADAVIAVQDRPATFGKVYPLGGGERLRFDRMLWRLRAAVPGFVLPLPIPWFIIRGARRLNFRGVVEHAGDAALQRLRSASIADNSAAARDFGYAPRTFDPHSMRDI